MKTYINFPAKAFIYSIVSEYPNLVVIQTLSKAWDWLAYVWEWLFASGKLLTSITSKTTVQYQQKRCRTGIQSTRQYRDVNEMIREIVKERQRLEVEFGKIPVVGTSIHLMLIFCCKVTDARAIYTEYLAKPDCGT